MTPTQADVESGMRTLDKEFGCDSCVLGGYLEAIGQRHYVEVDLGFPAATCGYTYLANLAGVPLCKINKVWMDWENGRQEKAWQ